MPSSDHAAGPGADPVATAVTERLADRLAGARNPARQRLAQSLRELGVVDRAVYAAVASASTPVLDVPVRRLSNAANNSRLWLGIAAGLAIAGGRRAGALR